MTSDRKKIGEKIFFPDTHSTVTADLIVYDEDNTRAKTVHTKNLPSLDCYYDQYAGWIVSSIQFGQRWTHVGYPVRAYDHGWTLGYFIAALHQHDWTIHTAVDVGKKCVGLFQLNVRLEDIVEKRLFIQGVCCGWSYVGGRYEQL